jgi:hypothetical protein
MSATILKLKGRFMNPSTDLNARLQKLFWILTAASVIFFIYMVVSAFIVRQNTGSLDLSSTKPNAVLSVSGSGSGAVIVGTGRARIRLSPGIYQVAASDNGVQTTATVQISKQQSRSYKLDFSKSITLPSVLDINFQNTGELIKSGLSLPQLNKLKRQFFAYKKTAKSVIIEAFSVRPAPRNPDTASTAFTSDFKVRIDDDLFNATITYGLRDITLVLHGPSGIPVFSTTN